MHLSPKIGGYVIDMSHEFHVKLGYFFLKLIIKLNKFVGLGKKKSFLCLNVPSVLEMVIAL